MLSYLAGKIHVVVEITDVYITNDTKLMATNDVNDKI